MSMIIEADNRDDADFDKKGYGMLNPFKKYNKRSDEEVKMNLVK